MTDAEFDLYIPSVEEMDYALGIAPTPVKKSPGAVKPAEKNPGKGQKQMAGATTKYDKLGLVWDKCPLRWDASATSRNGLGAKTGFKQHLGKDHPDWNGYVLRLDDLTVIDIDGTDEECEKLRALCFECCSFVAKTRKGNHFLFQKHPLVINKNAKAGAPEVDTKTGNQSLLVEPSWYEHPTEGIIRYKWLKMPETREDIAPMSEEVLGWLTKFGYTNEPEPPKPAPKNTVVYADAESDDDTLLMLPAPKRSSNFEEAERVCECLTGEFLDDFNNWIRVMFALKNIANTPQMRELFLRISKKAPRYDTPAHEAQNGKIWDGAKPAGRSGIGSLKHFAKKCNPEQYFSIAKDGYWALIDQDNANGYCEIFYNAMAGDILWSNAFKCYILYDEKETLWRQCEGDSEINFLFVEITSQVFRKMMADLPPATGEEAQEKRKKKEKRLLKAMKDCGGAFVITMVKNFLPALCKNGDEDPANYLNQNADLYPLANGVWKFSEKRLIPYERDHYFTFRVPIKYNPTADTKDIERASLDWFGQNKEVADFVRYWVGYCLTGETRRQDFLIVWGSQAGNGKSLLWGEILSLLLGKTDEGRCSKNFFHIMKSEDLSTERVGNNDAVYNLNGKRFTFLSEPREGRRTKLDKEMIKNITGDKYITAEAKYKNAIEFRITAKMAMACNKLPDLNLDDRGLYRRCLVLEQNIPFLDPADYARASEADKLAHKVKPKDDDFIERLKANTEGLLLWALTGAMEYADDPRKEPPMAMRYAKMKAVETTDTIGNWIKANIERAEGHNLKMRDIKDLMRQRDSGLDYNAKGFVAVFHQKAQELGYHFGGRIEKGDLYIKDAREVPEEDPDAE